MLIIKQDFQELFTNFNEVTYYDEPHKYYVNNKELTSVTALIHKYQEPFDENYWSEYKANEFGITKEDVLRAWRFINKKGTMKGSIIHDYAENKLLNKVFKYPINDIINEFGFDPILPEYEITKKHVDNFINVSKGKLIPIKTELIVYDIQSLIGGMVDFIVYNVKEKVLQLWDHKTNKKLSLMGDNNLKGKLSLIEDCDLNIYSLQLALYKEIIERNTNLKFGDSYITWYSHNNPNFEIIKTNDYSFYAKMIIEERILKLAS